RPLTETQTKRNRYLSKTRYVVEQSFGTLHRKFRYARAAYFGLICARCRLKGAPDA
ncbi:TPA: transposase, partial [Neisseria meningitidis]